MKVLFSIIFVASMLASPVFAQQRPGFQQNRRGPGGGGGASRPGSAGSSTLERAGLKVGQALPDISIYDAEGKPFPMAELKGKYSVVVFGCLT